MPVFEYHTFLCEQSDLQAALTEAGLGGWRLHTCDPVLTVGPQGSGVLHVLVVLDRLRDSHEGYEPEREESEGIAMKG